MEKDGGMTPLPPPEIGRSRKRVREVMHKRRRRREQTIRSSSSSSSSTSTKTASSGRMSSRSSSGLDTDVNTSNCKKKRRGKNALMEEFVEALKKRSHNSFAGAKNILPKFDPNDKGQTMEQWLRKVNETAVIYRWNDNEVRYNALSRLSGLALKWYEGLSTVNYTWKEWQRKLQKMFPDNRNYADKLTEMLNRRTRQDETLEEYFFEKSTLVSRCNIKGRDAVECITQGIYDNNIRLYAQGANISRPSKLLKYFRSVSAKKRDNRSRPYELPRPRFNNKTTTSRYEPTCYNCSEKGHTAPKCPKEAKKCTRCERRGHVEEHCKRAPRTVQRQPNVPVSNINLIDTDTAHDIYNKSVTIDGVIKSAFIDFGSECTVMKESISKEMNLKVIQDDLPVLKGFAAGFVKPLGKSIVEITVDFATATVDVFLVPDNFLKTDILIGQNFTELPNIMVHKTCRHLILYSLSAELEKADAVISDDTEINGLGSVSFNITTKQDYSGPIYVPGSTNLMEGNEVIVLQGVYQVTNGSGCIVVINISGGPISLKKTKLIARVHLLPIEYNLKEHTEKVRSLDINKLTISKETSVPKQPITMNMLNVGSETTFEQKESLLQLVNEFRDCFALDMSELGNSTISEMHINLNDDSPVAYKPYRLPYTERIIVRELVNEMLENNIVKESCSSYASPIVLVKKKNGEHRLCVDYRALNKKTVKDSYPMPVIDDQLDRLNGKTFFTSLDLKSGYYQIPMADDSMHLTAFVTPDGHFEYTRMPFGLVNAPAVFQHMINKALGPNRFDLALPYMDDILTPSSTIDDGMKKLRIIFSSLRDAGLTLNIAKCHFLRRNWTTWGTKFPVME